MTHWYWLVPAILLLTLNLLTRFRPLLSLSGGCLLASAAAYLRAPAWGQWLAVASGVLILEPFTRWLFRQCVRPAGDPKIQAIVGRTGRLRDIVDPHTGLFMLHCEGADWIGLPEEPGSVALGDTVEVVGAAGQRVVIRKLESTD